MQKMSLCFGTYWSTGIHQRSMPELRTVGECLERSLERSPLRVQIPDDTSQPLLQCKEQPQTRGSEIPGLGTYQLGNLGWGFVALLGKRWGRGAMLQTPKIACKLTTAVLTFGACLPFGRWRIRPPARVKKTWTPELKPGVRMSRAVCSRAVWLCSDRSSSASTLRQLFFLHELQRLCVACALCLHRFTVRMMTARENENRKPAFEVLDTSILRFIR